MGVVLHPAALDISVHLYSAPCCYDASVHTMLQLDFEMSQGLLPLDGAPPSAVILNQFLLKMELCFDEAAKNSEALWSVRWLAMFDCLRKGLHAFQTESFDGIEIDEAWTNYFDLNQDRFQNYRYQLESATIWMDEDSDITSFNQM